MLNVSVLSDTYTCCVTAIAKVQSPVTLTLDDSCQFDTCKYHLILTNFRISITTHSQKLWLDIPVLQGYSQLQIF